MRGGGRAAALLAASIVAALALSACLPFPPVIRGPERTRNVFMPGVAESGASVSPLRPSPLPSAVASSAAPAHATPTPFAASIHLQGPVWQWTASRFSDGTTLAPDDPARYTIEFLPDGNALVQADCNFGTGLYKEEGNRLSIGAIGATKVACPPDSLDSAFLAQLGKVERYEFEGEELAVRLQEDAGEMRLAAQPGTLPPTAMPTPTRTASPTPLPTPTATRTLAPSNTPSVEPSPTPTLPPMPATVELWRTAFAGAATKSSAWLAGM